MFEKEVMRGTKTLAGVLGDDCKTAMRLFACFEGRAAADDIDGMKRKTARTVVIFFMVITLRNNLYLFRIFSQRFEVRQHQLFAVPTQH